MSRTGALFPASLNHRPSSTQPTPSTAGGAARRDWSGKTFEPGKFAEAVETILCSGIKELCLNNCNLGDADAKAVGDLMGARSPLKQLRMSGNNFGQATAQRIGEALRHNENLELLDMSGNKLDLTAFVEILSPLCTPAPVKFGGLAEPINRTLSTLLLANNTEMFAALTQGHPHRDEHADAAHQLAALGAAPYLELLDLSGVDLPEAPRPDVELPKAPQTGTVTSTATKPAVAKERKKATAQKRELYANSSSLRERQMQFQAIPKPQLQVQVQPRKAQILDAKTAASCVEAINGLIQAHGPTTADAGPTHVSINPAFHAFVQNPNPVPQLAPLTATTTTTTTQNQPQPQPQPTSPSVPQVAPNTPEVDRRFVETTNAMKTLPADPMRFDPSLSASVSIVPEFDRLVETTNAAANMHPKPHVASTFTAWLKTTDGGQVGLAKFMKEHPAGLAEIHKYFNEPNPVFRLSPEGAIVCNRDIGDVAKLGQTIGRLSTYGMHSALIQISAAAAAFVMPSDVSNAVSFLYASVLTFLDDATTSTTSTRFDASVKQVFASVINAAEKANVPVARVAKLRKFLATQQD
ncbi:MAG: hypothetical protein V4787_14735 [Pseudomonadota bacterium]